MDENKESNKNNEVNEQISNEDLQKQLQEALEAQKKLQEEIDSLKKEQSKDEENAVQNSLADNEETTEESVEENKDIDVDQYIKDKEEKKKNVPMKDKLNGYGFTIIFIACLIASPFVLMKGKEILSNRVHTIEQNEATERENLNGDWTSADGQELHITEEGDVYLVEYDGKVVSKITRGVIHEDMVCIQNSCVENESETNESDGVDFSYEYINDGSDKYTNYLDIPADSYVASEYYYTAFKNKSATTLTLLDIDFTK